MREEGEEASFKAMYSIRLPDYMPRKAEIGNCCILLDLLPPLKPVAFSDLRHIMIFQ
jgi:hypothetical protein